MVESVKTVDLNLTLNPFYQRASQAESLEVLSTFHLSRRKWFLFLGTNVIRWVEKLELKKERLSRLEAAFNSKKDAGNEENLKMIDDLQSKLKVANAELISEKEKVLAAENKKLEYQIIHLVRSLKVAKLKLEQVTAQEQLESLKLQVDIHHR
ncbi:hypothetical protein CR513_10823, partial [Mucuna pruriens]